MSESSELYEYEKQRLCERIDFWKAECNKVLQENAELKRHNRDLRDNKLANDEAHYAQVTKLVDERDELKRDVQERHDATQENYEVILKLREQIIELERWNANLKTENFKLSQEAATILEHCKDLERIIAESQTRKPVFWFEVESSAGDVSAHEAATGLAYSTRISVDEPTPSYNKVFRLFTSPVIQEGMQLVPIEPTKKMIISALNCKCDGSIPLYQDVWEAMLNASKE